MTFLKSLLYFSFLALLFFSGGQKIFFVSCVIGFHRSQSQHIAAQASQALVKVQHVASLQAFVAKAGIVCEHWCLYIGRHQVPLCAVMLTHV